MSIKARLVIKYCPNQLLKHALMNWHYLRRIPGNIIKKYGIWENFKFKGCVVFGRGASPSIGKPFNLANNQICELVRVAFSDHMTPLSKIISICLMLLKKQDKEIRLVVSYADIQNQNHLGIIYQASNWIYVGESSSTEIKIENEWVHPRTVYSRYNTGSSRVLESITDTNFEKRNVIRYKYVYPMDKAMRRSVKKISLPYPKHASD